MNITGHRTRQLEPLSSPSNSTPYVPPPGPTNSPVHFFPEQVVEGLEDRLVDEVPGVMRSSLSFIFLLKSQTVSVVHLHQLFVISDRLLASYVARYPDAFKLRVMDTDT
jgi:hypothetical protein